MVPLERDGQQSGGPGTLVFQNNVWPTSVGPSSGPPLAAGTNERTDRLDWMFSQFFCSPLWADANSQTTETLRPKTVNHPFLM